MAETYYVLKINYQDKPPETRNIDAQITVIGRDQGDIILGDSQASGRHAEIHFVNGRVTVKDLGSTNGVLFNNVRTPQFAISAGQSFVCGQTTLQLMAIHGGPKAAFGGGKTMISMGAPPMPPRPGGLSPAPGSRIGGAAPPGAKPVFNSPFPPPAASPAPALAPTPAP
ncbi:MAG: FHA domain-containing protein, partial [Myxococcales bacterium]|nr:FHA domain-containing protein [Myxococcales bacterium]